ncbi:MAG: trypsin-like peptidase domain-containing protein [Planctomycetia bacterium]|nr:trypsin-like peptidase domain-containing protein [Planctomycetia bacterium]
MTRNTIFVCLISAALGAGVSIFYLEVPRTRLAMAQQTEPRLRLPTAPEAQVTDERVPLDELSPDERVNVSVYENVNRSVVNISTVATRPSAFMLLEYESEGAGSGSVLDKQGHILTNFHVVEGARDIQVTLYDGKSYEATPVGGDANSDVAVIKIDAPPESLFPVKFADSSRLRVGQRVFALGNPFGLDRTLTIGIISSLDRTLPTRNNRTVKSVIQTDAAINPGNSGGPLLDSKSRIIGMNTAIASKTGQSSGVGFAIPANMISRVVRQLIDDGRVIRPETGIALVSRTERGLRIAALAPDGPAERAGLRGPKLIRERKRQGPFVYEYQTVDRSAADLIVAVDDQSISTADDLLTIVESKRPGERVKITVLREGSKVDVPLVLGESE